MRSFLRRSEVAVHESILKVWYNKGGCDREQRASIDYRSYNQVGDGSDRFSDCGRYPECRQDVDEASFYLHIKHQESSMPSVRSQ